MSLRLRQGLRLESVGPVTGLLSFMGERNDSDLVVCVGIHDERTTPRPRSRSSYQCAASTSSSSASSSIRIRRVTCRRAQCRPAVAQLRARLPATRRERTVRFALRLFAPTPPPAPPNTRDRDFQDWRTTPQPCELVPLRGAPNRRSTQWLRLYPRRNYTSVGGHGRGRPSEAASSDAFMTSRNGTSGTSWNPKRR